MLVSAALLYDWYNAHILRRQNEDIGFYSALASEMGTRLTVLELGCGTGRVAIPLARAGHSVTGIDISESMVARAAWKAASDCPAQNLTWHVGDMSSFDLEQQFDLILISYSSFQLLATEASRLACLETTKRHLKPHGRLVVDISPNFLQPTSDSRRHVLTADCEEIQAVIALYSAVEQNWSTLTTSYRDEYEVFFWSGQKLSQVIHEKFHSFPRELMRSIIREVGLELGHVYGGYDCRPWDDGAYKNIYVLSRERARRSGR